MTINMDESILHNQSVVKLLGLHVGILLSFTAHVGEICRTAGIKSMFNKAFQNTEADCKLTTHLISATSLAT